MGGKFSQDHNLWVFDLSCFLQWMDEIGVNDS